MKKCGSCQINKPLEKFSIRGKIKQAWCKECVKKYDREYYAKNRDKKQAISLKRQKELVKWVRSLKDYPCVDCGVSYIYSVMHFDHIGNNKEFNISVMPYMGFSKKKILKEIAKCELVCANCHGIRTHNRREKSNTLDHML